MRKAILILSVAAFAAACCPSKDVTPAGMTEPTSVVLLYPKGQGVDQGIVENGVQVTLGPGESNGVTGPEIVKETGNILNTGDSARLRIFIPEKPNGQMIVVCPGGGYGNTAERKEGEWVAEWLTQRGISACVLVYRMPQKVHHIVPIRDVQNAFRYCRAHAAEWGINQIGVMGFSAGGHLAASASTLFVDDITRPDFSVLIYPVISFSDKFKKGGTMNNMTNGGEREDLVEFYSLENRVSAETPPAFIALSADDTGVDPEHSWRYFSKLKEYGIGAEMYILPCGKHGWGWMTEEHGEDKLKDGVRNVFFTALENFLYRISLPQQAAE